MRTVRLAGLAIAAALATTIAIGPGQAGAHNDKGVLTVVATSKVGLEVTVTATLIYSEDKHPVDDAKVTLALTDDPASAVQMTAADAAGTYTGKVTAKKAGMVKLHLSSEDPVAELDIDENVAEVTTTTTPSTTTTEKPLPDEDKLSPSTVAPTTTAPESSKETSSESGSRWLLPAGIGAAIVVLLGAFVAVSRNKKQP